MALDALRSTFRRPASSPPTAPAGTVTPAAAATFQPGTPTFPPVSSWGQPPAVNTMPTDSVAEPYGLPPQPMLGAASQPAQPASPSASTYAADQYAAVFADPIAGGGTDTKAFGCPSCGRTLDRGTVRCKDCGTWLLLDLPLRRAATLMGGGFVAGVLITTVLVNVFAPAKPAAVAGVDGTTGTPGSGSAAAPAEIPSGALAALRGTTAINGRLAAEAAPLRKALDAKKFRTSDVQKVLRRMAIDTRAGAGMLAPLAAWPEATGQQAALDSFYADLQRQIDAGLSASVRSTNAYRKAAKAILSTLALAPRLDTDARALGGQAGIELQPVSFPNEVR